MCCESLQSPSLDQFSITCAVLNTPTTGNADCFPLIETKCTFHSGYLRPWSPSLQPKTRASRSMTSPTAAARRTSSRFTLSPMVNATTTSTRAQTVLASRIVTTCLRASPAIASYTLEEVARVRANSWITETPAIVAHRIMAMALSRCSAGLAIDSTRSSVMEKRREFERPISYADNDSGSQILKKWLWFSTAL